jgi:mgtE-like transporter
MPSEIKKIIKESLPVLFLAMFGGVFAGLILDFMMDEFRRVPGLLVLLPPILAMRGNISSVLASRLSSALHLGLIQPEFKLNKTLNQNIVSSIILNVVMAFFLGVVAYYTYTFIGGGLDASILDLTLIAVLTGSLAGILLTFLAVVFSLYTYASGRDPDNVVSPLLSMLGDLLTVLCLLVVTRIVV